MCVYICVVLYVLYCCVLYVLNCPPAFKISEAKHDTQNGHIWHIWHLPQATGHFLNDRVYLFSPLGHLHFLSEKWLVQAGIIASWTPKVTAGNMVTEKNCYNKMIRKQCFKQNKVFKALAYGPCDFSEHFVQILLLSFLADFYSA